MDGLRLPPLIEETPDPTDESTDLKAEEPIMSSDLTEKERENAELEGEEKEVKEEKAGDEVLSEEQELEELRAQVLQLLLELEEARDASQKHQENFLELQGLLEDERLASAHQAEAFTHQIQHLQAQLRGVQDELDRVQELKDSELAEAQAELSLVREEVQALREAAEECAAERENDIASLQEELCRVRAEMSRVEATAQEYELEAVTLRAEIAMKSQRREQERREGDVVLLREECSSLKAECETLKEANSRLTEKLQLLQDTRNASVCPPLKEEQEEGEKEAEGSSVNTVESSNSNCRLVDASIQKNISFEGKPLTPTSWSAGFSEILSLREQLKQAEERAEQVQRQCDGVRIEMRELQDLFETSQKERAELELELLRCREELDKLTEGNGTQFSTEPPVLSLPFIGLIVIVAVLWCCWSELGS
ncbi:coiled-coil domain-containing protein 136 isoform X1 [Colossoma macropomum]|uniref:coiled-coil domain-containing protein 136 isoform X1 n=2 Tax=Colossoma macropomum TaxID=42526 RepID=UPI0018652C18|nr:coiled-coil domain-containing protein 136 isoform X1 [Colossoma macropomum]